MVNLVAGPGVLDGISMVRLRSRHLRRNQTIENTNGVAESIADISDTFGMECCLLVSS